MNILLAGKPGVGKTTLVERVVEQLRQKLRIAGFITTEVRGPDGQRIGFDVVTVDGRHAEVAARPFWAGRRRDRRPLCHEGWSGSHGDDNLPDLLV